MGKATFWSQFKVLTWKSFILKKRNKKQTIQEVMMPIYFIAILALIKGLVKPKTFSGIGHFQAHSLQNGTFTGSFKGRILVTPNTSYTHEVMERTLQILDTYKQPSFTASFYSSQEAAVAAYKANMEDVAAGIVFNYSSSALAPNLSYAIRMPFSQIASTDSDKVYTDQSQCRGGGGTDNSSCDANTYLYTGFSVLQTAIDTALMQISLNDSSVTAPGISVQMLPKPGYIPDTSYIQIISSLYFVIAYSPFINFLTVNLVAEKEKKIKEGMKMMGLRDSAFWLSWGFIYSVIIAVVTGVVIVIAVVSKFFANSNMFLFFLMLLLYGVSIIGASFAITPFFSKAQVAGMMASLASMMISTLYLIVSLTRSYTASGVEYSIPVWGRGLLCLLSPVALALAIDQAVYLDIVNPDGMTFSTITQGEFPAVIPVVMLLVDSALYFLLAIYLDNVIPGEYGPRYPFWYPFSPSYWCSSWRQTGAAAYSNFIMTEADHDVSTSNDDVERVADSRETNLAVRIDNLTKLFTADKQQVTAVNGLSLDIYENEITALLGHNGAGKTTTLNILTGLTGPSSGQAHIMGLNVSNSQAMTEIRAMTGVCPQHNILFDDLTCLEHLQLFAGIKGIPELDRDTEIEEALSSVGLKDQVHVRSIALSGGQKRKLSVAIAIVGDPKIIFLDEPTAGMDPFSRRHLWSVLKEKKKGRVILLTTHFMDEADILADRKAIISKGSLRCCGSSLFLKNRFGIGYHLNMVVSSDCNVDRLKTFVLDHVTGAELNRARGQEVDVTLPLSQVASFAGLFNALEESMVQMDEGNALGIQNYGVSMTSLEEVFLKLEEDEGESGGGTERPGVHEDNTLLSEGTERMSIPQTDSVPVPTHLLQGGQLAVQRFLALLKVRFLTNIRNRQLLFFQLILPIILLVVGLMVSKNSHPPLKGSNPSPLEIGPFYYGKMKFGPHPVSRFGPMPPLLYHDNVDSTLSDAFCGNMSLLFYMDPYTNTSYLLQDGPHYIGFNLTEFTITSQEYVALYNDSAVHAVPAIINLMTNGIFKLRNYLAGNVDNSSYISVTSLPWPTTFEELAYNNAAFSSVILLAMAFTTIPGGFGVDVVRDRQSKVRSQLRISGVPFSIYWGSYFTMDAIKYFIPAVLTIIITFIIKVESLQQGGAVCALIFMCLTYIPANILLSYALSFSFDKWETAQAVQPLIFFFGGFMPYLPVALVDAMTSESTASILHLVFCFTLPPYTIFGGLYYIDKVYRVAAMKLSTSSIVFSDYFTQDILVAILVPLAHVCLCFMLLCWFDVRMTTGGRDTRKMNFANPLYEDSVPGEDEDVTAERHRVRDIQDQQQQPVALVSHLWKEFVKSGSTSCVTGGKDKVKMVVNNSSFAIGAGEVFGLLGPNGAGKTTTINMMTADITPTRGKVMIGGHDVESSVSEAFQAMGYCPQHDAQWDTVTLREHLECYIKVRGVPTQQMEQIITYFTENLQLQDHVNKRAKKLSGGTKRKLSYIMSVLGRPKIVLMDEPSTGMDPQSKRFLWDTISSSFRGSERGALLTTHYMEEADALCSRITIMVNGQLKCIGSSQHLKSKYGSGYQLDVKLQALAATQRNTEKCMEQLHQFVVGNFPRAVRMEVFSERAQYKIPRSDVDSLAKAFTVLENGKQYNSIEEYSFSQSTLEQVFLEFAKQQTDEGVADSS